MRKLPKAQSDFFVQQLLQWNKESNTRKLPWKGIKNAYRIWVSEIMLQQTQAETVIPYYKAFIKKFPTIDALAKAKKEEVFAMWQGLGYYRRCENLIKACQTLRAKKLHTLPADYTFIRSLSGIGNYTAAAICSFAFNLPYAVVDANVQRILWRYFGLPLDISKKELEALAQDIATNQKMSEYNQAIMDFGAMVCKAKNPLCAVCYLQKQCFAFHNPKQGLVAVLPKKKKTKVYWYFFVVLAPQKKMHIIQRQEKGIWKNLFTPLYIESDKILSKPKAFDMFCKKYSLRSEAMKVVTNTLSFRQTLSHRQVFGQYAVVYTKQKIKGSVPVDFSDLVRYGFPKIVVDIFQKENLEINKRTF